MRTSNRFVITKMKNHLRDATISKFFSRYLNYVFVDSIEVNFLISFNTNMNLIFVMNIIAYFHKIFDKLLK